jgi:hypothetical protein
MNLKMKKYGGLVNGKNIDCSRMKIRKNNKSWEEIYVLKKVRYNLNRLILGHKFTNNIAHIYIQKFQSTILIINYYIPKFYTLHSSLLSSSFLFHSKFIFAYWATRFPR